MAHVVSGQATTYYTLEGLLAFIARVLAKCGAGPPEAGKADGGCRAHRPARARGDVLVEGFDFIVMMAS